MKLTWLGRAWIFGSGGVGVWGLAGGGLGDLDVGLWAHGSRQLNCHFRAHQGPFPSFSIWLEATSTLHLKRDTERFSFQSINLKKGLGPKAICIQAAFTLPFKIQVFLRYNAHWGQIPYETEFWLKKNIYDFTSYFPKVLACTTAKLLPWKEILWKWSCIETTSKKL